MIDDQILIKYAAKAIGKDITEAPVYSGVRDWNPIYNTEDALELVFKLGFVLDFSTLHAQHFPYSQVYIPGTSIEFICAADVQLLRHCITHAAAKVGGLNDET